MIKRYSKKRPLKRKWKINFSFSNKWWAAPNYNIQDDDVNIYLYCSWNKQIDGFRQCKNYISVIFVWVLQIYYRTDKKLNSIYFYLSINCCELHLSVSHSTGVKGRVRSFKSFYYCVFISIVNVIYRFLRVTHYKFLAFFFWFHTRMHSFVRGFTIIAWIDKRNIT